MKKNSFIQGTIIASIAIIFIKFLGAIYVIPFYKIIGEDGGTLYSYAYNIYNLFLNISIAGIPIAVSKIISEYNAQNMYNAKEKSYKIARNIMALLAIFTFLIMFVFSEEIAYLIIGNSTTGSNIIDVTYVLRMISFCLLIIPFLSVTKGYLQGHKFIKEPSNSQIIEQIVRIVIVLLGSYITINILHKSITTGVGVALLGALIGGLVAWTYLKVKIHKNKDKFAIDNPDNTEVATKIIIKKIFAYSIPLVIISIAGSLYDSTDLILVIKGLKLIGYSDSNAQLVSSIIATWAPKICMIVNSIAMGLSINIIPHMADSYVKKNYQELGHKFVESINTILIITIPMAIGISLLANPIYTIFYGTSIYGGHVLRIYAFISVLSSLNIVLSMALQGINCYKIVYINTIVGLATNAILDIPLIILFNKFGLYPFYGALVSTIIGFTLSFVIIFVMIRKEITINYNKIGNLIKKMFIPLLFMVTAIVILNLFIDFSGSRIKLILLVAIYAFIGATIYFVGVYKNGALNDVFGSEYIAKVLRKLKIKKN